MDGSAACKLIPVRSACADEAPDLTLCVCESAALGHVLRRAALWATEPLQQADVRRFGSPVQGSCRRTSGRVPRLFVTSFDACYLCDRSPLVS
jgi:hypothetical protein